MQPIRVYIINFLSNFSCSHWYMYLESIDKQILPHSYYDTVMGITKKLPTSIWIPTTSTAKKGNLSFLQHIIKVHSHTWDMIKDRASVFIKVSLILSEKFVCCSIDNIRIFAF